MSEVVPDARIGNLRCSLCKSSGRLLGSCSMVSFSERWFLGLLCSWFLGGQKEKQCDSGVKSNEMRCHVGNYRGKSSKSLDYNIKILSLTSFFCIDATFKLILKNSILNEQPVPCSGQELSFKTSVV